MHARTFKRAMEKVYAAEEIVDAHSDFLLDRVKPHNRTRAKALLARCYWAAGGAPSPYAAETLSPW
jgi:hypothetical protein